MKVKTTDIYLGAYLLAKGAELESLTQQIGHKGRIIFIFTSNRKVEQLNQEYKLGKGSVNPLSLKQSILQLKDAMYDKIRVNKEERTNGNSERNHRLNKKYL